MLLRLKNQKGAAAVEFAIILPILLILIFGFCQFGIVFYRYLTITHVAREISRLAAVGEYDTENEEGYLTDFEFIEEIEVSPENPVNIGEEIKVVVKSKGVQEFFPILRDNWKWDENIVSTASMRFEYKDPTE